MSIDYIYLDREDPSQQAEAERVTPLEFQQLCIRNLMCGNADGKYHVPYSHRDTVLALLATMRREAARAGQLTRRDRYIIECLKLIYTDVNGESDEDIAKMAVELADAVLDKAAHS